MNPLTASRLDQYLSSLQEGLSETANKGKIFDQQMLHQKSKIQFINEIMGIALFATQIPLTYSQIYSNRGLKSIQCWNQRFEILQQFYIQMETQSDEFHLFAGDLST